MRQLSSVQGNFSPQVATRPTRRTKTRRRKGLAKPTAPTSRSYSTAFRLRSCHSVRLMHASQPPKRCPRHSPPSLRPLTKHRRSKTILSLLDGTRVCTDMFLAFSLLFLLLYFLVPFVSALEPRDSAPLLVVVVRPRGLREQAPKFGKFEFSLRGSRALRWRMLPGNHALCGSETRGSANVNVACR